MNKTIEEIREIAHQKAQEISYIVKKSPMETLKSIDFKIPMGGSIDQRHIALVNLELGSESCLGRVAVAAAIMEKHFPNTQIQFAEVWEDSFRNGMLDMLNRKPEKKYNDIFMRELMMYEEPHAVLLVDGKQFEPISTILGIDVSHPKIQPFQIWEGITSSRLVSVAFLESHSKTRMKILKMAEKICPGTTLVEESMLSLMSYEDSILIERVRELYKKRPCARTLFILFALTREQKYHQELISRYGTEYPKYL